MAKHIGSWSGPRGASRTVVSRRDPGDVIRRHLKPGEQVVWTGCGSGVRAGLYLLSTFFLACLAGWLLTVVVVSIAGLTLPPLMAFVVAFLLVDYVMLRSLFSPAFEVYALTARRLVVIQGLFPRTVRSYGPETINALTVSGTRAKGTVIFRRASPSETRGWMDAPAGFRGIDNPRDVAEQIQKTLSPRTRLDNRTI
jgi:hypothetical protein